MPTYTTSKKSRAGGASYGDALNLYGNVTVPANANLAAGNGDEIRVVFVPAGTEMHALILKNGDLDSGVNLAAKIGYEFDDGTVGDDDIFAVAGVWGQAAAQAYYLLDAPITVDKDAWITVTVTNTVAAANATPVGVSGLLLGALRGVA